MSYLVMARKWRPQAFEDVVGQQHVTQTLKNAITTDRIHHAYLFTGTRGVGKTTSARILAKALNCATGPTPEPCGVCQHCTEITSGHHIDVMEIDGASNRGIDEIRDLREKVRYMPSSARFKVYIIDEVHMLTTEAFNALLKTLEEPPAHVVFIFATTEVHKIPATILSRCQKFDFRRISQQEIQTRLTEIVTAEKAQIDEAAIYLIAKKADGSMRDGESLLDQIVSFSRERVTAQDVQRILGVVDQDLYFQVTDAITASNINAGLDIVENIFTNGFDLHEFTIGLIEHFRNLLIVKTDPNNATLINIPANFADTYRQTAERFNATDILRLLDIALKMELETKKNVHSRAQLELRLIAMITQESSISLTRILEFISLGHLPSLKTDQPVTVAPPVTTPIVRAHENVPIVKEPPAMTEPILDLDSLWPLFVEAVAKSSKMLSSLLIKSRPFQLDQEILKICFEPVDASQADVLKDPTNRKKLEVILRDVLKKSVRIEILTQPINQSSVPEIKNTSPVEAKDLEESPLDLKSNPIIEKTPGLKLVMELFEGELVN